MDTFLHFMIEKIHAYYKFSKTTWITQTQEKEQRTHSRHWSWSSILWPSDVKNWLIRKSLDAGKVWRQEEKGMTEFGMFGWRHWLKGHEFEQILGDGEGQGSLECCSPWGCKELDMMEQLNNKLFLAFDNHILFHIHKLTSF